MSFKSKRRACMLEYLPWSNQERAACLEAYKNGQFSILDIELGGECNYNCVYCDSPDRKKDCLISLSKIEQLMQNGKFRWVYICGLGEPTFNKNYKLLMGILHLCEKYGLKCSIFSNISYLTEELKEYIRKHILFILFKFDTQYVSLVKTLYGTRRPSDQLKAIDEIKSLVYFENGTTNIAASIVPTQLNQSEILNIVADCLNSNIFPLLGELELSGKGLTNYENLFLSAQELISLKIEIERLCGSKYMIPVCPAVINGVHINNRGDITVDSFSGLSCHWFWLQEPKTVVLTHLDQDNDLRMITSIIFDYRNKRFTDVVNYLKSYSGIGGAFGGCGGDIEGLFNEYLRIHGGD